MMMLYIVVDISVEKEREARTHVSEKKGLSVSFLLRDVETTVLNS